MYVQVPSQRQEYRRTMLERAQALDEWKGSHLGENESFAIWWSEDGLRFTVGICSIRAEQLMLRLHKDVLSGFVMNNFMRSENGVWSAWFGYSEPF